MSKGDGSKIAIKFSRELVGDVRGKEEITPYRFYKWIISNTWSGSRLYLYELEMYRDNGTRIDNSSIVATQRSSAYSSSYDVNKLFDGVVPGTEWDANGSLPHWVVVELNVPEPLGMFRWHTSTGSNKPKSYKLQGSNDGIVWTDIAEGESPNINNWVDISIEDDIKGNEVAFKVEGQEYTHILGKLVDREYRVNSVERYPIKRIWEDDFEDGIKDNLYTVENGLAIVIPQEKIYPVADTYARQKSTNTNYGSSGELCVLGTSDYYTRTYLKFDVPLLPIVKAELFLFYFANDIPNREQRHHIKRIIENWEEMTLTYSNAPNFEGMGSLTAGSYGTLVNVDGHGTGINKWRSADITNLVKEWQDGTYSNHGLVLDHNYNSSYYGGIWASIKYRSKEYEDSNFHPYIKLVYDDNVSFDMEGTYSTSFQINGQYRIKWLEETPEDTAIKIELATVENEFSEISSGDVINANGTVWIKATLSTEDVNKTPILKELWLEDANFPDDTILLNMKDYFRNVEGDLTIKYNQILGDLTGEYAEVETFEEIFTPTDLEPHPNPWIREYVNCEVEAIVELTKIEKKETSIREYVKCTVDVQIGFYLIEDAPL